MSDKLPLLSAKELLKILEKLGFRAIRQKGSHIYMKHNDGRATVIPMHPGNDLGRGLLRQIINEIDMPRGDFVRLAKKK